MPDVSIRTATLADLAPLLALARQSYLEHYAQLWTAENLDRYLDYAYTEDLFRDFLTDPDTIVWIAEAHAQMLGYLVFKSRDSLLPELPGGCQIKRLYLLATAAGRGLGRALLDTAVAAAEQLGRDYVWLDVMQCSAAAIAFYQKSGFEIHSATRFQRIPFRRPELAEMWNMVRRLR